MSTSGISHSLNNNNYSSYDKQSNLPSKNAAKYTYTDVVNSQANEGGCAQPWVNHELKIENHCNWLLSRPSREERRQLELDVMQRNLTNVKLNFQLENVTMPSCFEEITPLHRAIVYLGRNLRTLSNGIGGIGNSPTSMLGIALNFHDFNEHNSDENVIQRIQDIMEKFEVPDDEFSFDTLRGIERAVVERKKEHMMNDINEGLVLAARNEAKRVINSLMPSGALAVADKDELRELENMFLNLFQQTLDHVKQMTSGFDQDKRQKLQRAISMPDVNGYIFGWNRVNVGGGEYHWIKSDSPGLREQIVRFMDSLDFTLTINGTRHNSWSSIQEAMYLAERAAAGVGPRPGDVVVAASWMA